VTASVSTAPTTTTPWAAERLIPAVLALVGFGIVGLAAADVSAAPWAGARALLTPTYLLLGPGWAIAGLIRGTSVAARAVLALGTGLAVSVLVGQAMVLTQAWHPVGMLYAVALLVQPVLVVHALRRARP